MSKSLNLKKMCDSTSWRAVIWISNDHYGNVRFCSCCTVLIHTGFIGNLSPSLRSVLSLIHQHSTLSHTYTHICTLTHSSFSTPTTGSWQNALRRPPKWQQLSWPGIFWAQVKNVAQHKGPVPPPPPQPLYSLETKPGSVAWSVRLDLWIEPAIQQW